MGMSQHGKKRETVRRKTRPNSWIKMENNHHPTENVQQPLSIPSSINGIWKQCPRNSCGHEGVVGLLIFGLIPEFLCGQRQEWEVAPVLWISRKFCIVYAVIFLVWGHCQLQIRWQQSFSLQAATMIWCFVNYTLRSPSDEPLQCPEVTTANRDAVKYIMIPLFSQIEPVNMGILRLRDLKRREEGEVRNFTLMTNQIR